MHQVGYLPVHQSEGATWRELVFPCGVTARFRDEMLESIRLIERENKSSSIALVSDEREPTPEQISDMFSEATLAVQAGAKRAALLIAWAGLEATLRRAAFRAGRRGKVGTQPVVLLRELVAEGQVTAPEHRTLEHLRQLRMSAAHGLTPVAFPSDLISNIKAVSDRLLATTTLMPDRRVDWTQRATLSGTSRVGNRNLVRRTCELLNYVVVARDWTSREEPACPTSHLGWKRAWRHRRDWPTIWPRS